MLAQSARPNIVFILTDDQRWDAMSCAGHPFIKTPNLDRIAREGVLFRNAFVTTPLCSPSRASFLTGQYSHQHGVTHNGESRVGVFSAGRWQFNPNAGGPAELNALTHRLITYPRLLHDAGYETAWMGKLHMGNDDTPRPGFDHWVGFKGQGVFNDPELNIDGNRVRVRGYTTDILSGKAAEFIRRDHSKPFSLCVCHKAVHDPTTPAERHKDLFANEVIPRSPAAKDTLEGKPVLLRPEFVQGEGRGRPPGPGTGTPDAKARNQLRCLMSVEEGVGQILKALEEKQALDNTLVVFTSDNGYFWGEHGLSDKRFAYEDGLRVPMVMRYPKLIKPGITLDHQVLNIDIAPTMLDLAGVPAPKNMHGRSLVPLFKGKARWRNSFLAEYDQEMAFPWFPSWKAVRTDRYKYIHFSQHDGLDELYDLKNDPYEMKNLIGDPGARRLLAGAKAELGRLLKETR